jgi:RNA polymerase sigma factor (sigma-70 family)
VKKPETDDYKVIWDLFIADGNQEALGVIYFSHYNLLYNFGLKYTNDVHMVEDAIQDLFSYLLKSGRHLSPVINLRAYLLQSFRHQLMFDLKKKTRLINLKHFSGHTTECHEPEVNGIFEKEYSNQLEQKIGKCIQHLSAKQKEVIFLRFQSELSYNEIALMLDITVDSCYKLVYRSLKEIRVELERMHITSKHLMLFFLSKF